MQERVNSFLPDMWEVMDEKSRTRGEEIHFVPPRGRVRLHINASRISNLVPGA